MLCVIKITNTVYLVNNAAGNKGRYILLLNDNVISSIAIIIIKTMHKLFSDSDM